MLLNYTVHPEAGCIGYSLSFKGIVFIRIKVVDQKEGAKITIISVVQVY